MTANELQDEYSIKLYVQIMDIFKEDCENRIETKNIDGNCFFHALTLASAAVYGRLTGEETNVLEFNYIQNRLIMQFAATGENQ